MGPTYREPTATTLKPPPIAVVKGCGCLVVGAMVFAAINFIMALANGGFDPFSVLLFVGALYAGVIVRNLKRLYRPQTTDEIIRDARDSTYRSVPTERAFRLLGCYLPSSAFILFIYILETAPEQAGSTLIAVAPALLGVLTLAGKRYFQKLRFKQVQCARDSLADRVFSAVQHGSLPSTLADRIFFLYLRPFETTDSMKAVAADSLGARGIDLEIRVSDAVARWGPLISLGEPGEARGAGRARVTEEAWRTTVQQALSEARYIFLLPGSNAGISWEIALIRERRIVDRVIFIQPPRTRHFTQESWDRAREVMARTGLSAPPKLFWRHGCFFTLNSDGKIAHVVRFSRFVGTSKLYLLLRRLTGMP